MNKETIIKFRDQPIRLTFFKYNDGRVGALMIHNESGQFWGNATLQLDCHIPNNEVLIKSYGDNNVGLYETLLKEDIIKPFRRMYDVGLKKAHVCELSDKILKLLNT